MLFLGDMMGEVRCYMETCYLHSTVQHSTVVELRASGARCLASDSTPSLTGCCGSHFALLNNAQFLYLKMCVVGRHGGQCLQSQHLGAWGQGLHLGCK